MFVARRWMIMPPDLDLDDEVAADGIRVALGQFLVFDENRTFN